MNKQLVFIRRNGKNESVKENECKISEMTIKRSKLGVKPDQQITIEKI